MMSAVTLVLSGALFAMGLVWSGMTLPSKVIGFLDVFGDWDPSLGLVMAGAILVHLPAYHLIRRARSAPVLGGVYSIPVAKQIDRRLMTGAVLFGVGWGIAGFCPGPAIISTLSLQSSNVVFAGAMVAGMVLFRLWDEAMGSARQLRKAARTGAELDGT